MKEAKELNFGIHDFYAPLIYLLYRKGIISEEEVNRYTDSYKGPEMYSFANLERIERMLGGA